MKRTLLILTTLFICNFLFANGNQTKDLVKVFDVSKGMELQAQINPGEIVVETGDASQVKVTVKGLREDDYENLDIEMRGNRLVVEYDDRSSGDDVEFIFTIPENFHMSLNTTGGDIKIHNKIIGKVYVKTSGGDIKTQDMQGIFSCTTMGGDIKLGNINGELSAETYGGDIKAGNVTGESAKLNTMGGDVKIQNSEGSLTVTTYGGDIKAGDAGGDVKAVTYGGDVRLGTVSGSVEMETYGGNLDLEGARGTVEADTKGGDITLQNIIGSVESSTSGGDVSVELTPSETGNSTLKSSGGDIELIIPENAKVSIEAEIKLQGNARGKTDKYTITSNFLNIDQVPSDNGKWISTSTTLNGGGHKIILKTTNSNIKIIKQN